MATTTPSLLYQDDNTFIIRFASVTTDAIEDDVVKIDSSAYCPKHFAIQEIWWAVCGVRVRLYWEATTDELFMGFGYNAITDSGHLDFSSFGGIKPPDIAGMTGDLGLTTQNPDTNDTYSFVIRCRKL